MPYQFVCTIAITKITYTNSLNIGFDWHTNLFFLVSNNLFRLEGFSVQAYFLRNEVPGVVRKRFTLNSYISSHCHFISFLYLSKQCNIIFQPSQFILAIMNFSIFDFDCTKLHLTIDILNICELCATLFFYF